MQRSWRGDADKLTFIILQPCMEELQTAQLNLGQTYTVDGMTGDINLFVSINDDATDILPRVVGELELMIAETENQRKGYGRTAVLMFLQYVIGHEIEILYEFQKWSNIDSPSHSRKVFEYLRVRIAKDNFRSIALFEALGFRKTTTDPNVFDEFELRHYTLNKDHLSRLLEKYKYNVAEYTELNVQK